MARAPSDTRRCQLYGIGTAKSGTHSLAAMFARGARAQHEPQSKATVEQILAHAEGRLDAHALAGWLRARDRSLELEVEVSHFNYFLLDPLMEQFPRARFVLTLRDCYRWLDSIIDDALNYPAEPHWLRLRDLRYRPERFRHCAGERVLMENGLYTVEGYLSYWARHNTEVLERVPAGRLYVVRTDRLAAEASAIAAFAGLPADAADAAAGHAYRAPRRHGLVSRIDRSLLEETVERHCRALMARYFPEIRSLDDAAPAPAS